MRKSLLDQRDMPSIVNFAQSEIRRCVHRRIVLIKIDPFANEFDILLDPLVNTIVIVDSSLITHQFLEIIIVARIIPRELLLNPHSDHVTIPHCMKIGLARGIHDKAT
jgi:hypothetical protein